MEQFRQIGEVLGSIKSLMVFRDNIQINQRQCSLLLDIFTSAYDSIAEEMRENLKFEEKQIKWKILEQPLKELCRVLKGGETYIRQCLESKDWWAKAITLYQNTDCVELHIHNLLSCVPSIIEAIEIADEASGWDHDEMHKKRLVYSSKYMKRWNDPQLFRWKFGKQYLVTQEICKRLDTVWKEDRWVLISKIQEKKNRGAKKQERKLADSLLKNLADGSENSNKKLLPCSILVNSKGYHVKRRLGNGSQYKEITWLGESFALRHFFDDIEALIPEISLLLSLSHPNIASYLCGFTDEEKKECFLVMELMSKTLGAHIKEVSGPRKKNTISLPLAVDLMLQIARGMEYLHSKKNYHGELNPSNILVKSKGNDNLWGDGYLHARIFGFGLNSVKNFTPKNENFLNQNENFPFIWYAPEVLEEQEQMGSAGNLKYTEKSDVYSFGMVCFELITGKVPFEDSHLQGEKMSRNIRAGERPLFPFYSPKYITNLTKKCWHADPNQRPSFSSICRILRYIKRFLAMNPECYNNHQDPPVVPLVDYCDIEPRLLHKFYWENSESSQVSQIPFQMFAYRVEERERTYAASNLRDTSESGSDRASVSGDENGTVSDDPYSSSSERRLSGSNEGMNKRSSSSSSLLLMKRSMDLKPIKQPGTPRGRSRPPLTSPCGRDMRMNSESQLMLMSPRMRRSSSGHVSDSDLS